jgi:CheY-like chemotaxis protein
MKILIIDDNEQIRRSTARCLQIRGHEVLLADNGLEGLALALEATPDRILCDYDMPGINGVQVYERLPVELQERLYLWTGSDAVSFPRVIEKPCNFLELTARAHIV